MLERMLIGEHIELERMMQLALNGDITPTEQNLSALATLIRHRLKQDVTVDELLAKELDCELDEFDVKINQLIAPFARGYRKAMQARQTKMLEAVARMTNPPTGA